MESKNYICFIFNENTKKEDQKELFDILMTLDGVKAVGYSDPHASTEILKRFAMVEINKQESKPIIIDWLNKHELVQSGYEMSDRQLITPV
jgi:cell division protein FtsX